MTDESSAVQPNPRETIGPVLGRIPSGLSILTATDGKGNETGMLASWVQQASFDPPMITIAVNRKRYLNDWLSDSATVVLNLLGESHGQFLKHFGKGFEPGEPAFEGLEIQRSQSGLPVLAESLGHLEGRITGKLDTGDHIVYSVEITSAAAGPSLETEKPFVHVRKNGFNY